MSTFRWCSCFLFSLVWADGVPAAQTGAGLRWKVLEGNQRTCRNLQVHRFRWWSGEIIKNSLVDLFGCLKNISLFPASLHLSFNLSQFSRFSVFAWFTVSSIEGQASPSHPLCVINDLQVWWWYQDPHLSSSFSSLKNKQPCVGLWLLKGRTQAMKAYCSEDTLVQNWSSFVFNLRTVFAWGSSAAARADATSISSPGASDGDPAGLRGRTHDPI